MIRPLKQIVTFEDDEAANAWLSARENDKYDFKVYFYSAGTRDFSRRWISIVYWENPS